MATNGLGPPAVKIEVGVGRQVHVGWAIRRRPVAKDQDILVLGHHHLDRHCQGSRETLVAVRAGQ